MGNATCARPPSTPILPKQNAPRRPFGIAGPLQRLLHFLGGSYLIRRASMLAISRLANSSVKNHS
jgi:hypothetical protein